MKKQLKLLSLLLVITFVTLSFANKMAFFAANATYVEGDITQDTVWTLIDSPFVVSKNITVYQNVKLTIEPGVEVRFGGSFSITVEGVLDATGTPNSAITFTSNKDQPQAGDWDTIKFNGTTPSTLAYCVLKYATNGMTIENSNVEIKNSEVSFSYQNGIAVSNGTANIQNSRISDNLVNGIYVTGNSQVTVQNNTVEANANGVLLTGESIIRANITRNTVLSNIQSGIYLDVSDYSNIVILYNNLSANNRGFYVSNTAITVIINNSISYNNIGIFYQNASHIARWNDIYGNVLGMDVSIDASVNAEYNYWGDKSGPYHTSLNPAGKGNPVGGNGYNLDFIFFLTAPIGYINQRPVAMFLTDKTLVAPNQVVWFVATNSSDDRQVNQYFYDFGDGTNSSWTTLSIFAHKYSSVGPYTARVTVKDDFDVTSTNVANVVINVLALTPIDVSLTLASSTVVSEEQVSITVRASVGASPIANASIALLSIAKGSLATSFGSSDSAGYFTTMLTAPNVAEKTDVRIIATSSKSDYADGSDFKYLQVLPLLSVQVSADPNSIKSEAFSNVTVSVTHKNNPISDAIIRVSSSNGSFSIERGYTNSNGSVTFNFTAPLVMTQSNVSIIATVTKSAFFESEGQTQVTVNPRKLTAQITPSGDLVKSEDTLNMTVYVTEDASPIAGANITMSSDQGGTFLVTSGSTDSNGSTTFTFTAPQVTTQTNLTITATATKSGYLQTQNQTRITVNPRLLTVQVTASSDTIESENAVTMTVHVTEDSKPIAGTNITMSSDQGGTFSITTGITDSNGEFTFIFTALKITTQVNVTITVTATKTGYVEDTDQTNIVVNPTPSAGVGGLPWTTTLLIVIPIVVVAIVAVLIKKKITVISSE
jgi:parallel beta-helix repeat protein